ncbi:SKA complex subunit 2 [Chanos chanos]|uniref:Protein FAM33A n=1 Tax=Chanos chanos TaxID=29144 RepID=A0A6J2WWN6_CHACN|nr:spindle and kinetochore-associated protein 2 [Chanos chanos]
METAVDKLEAMFQKAEADLEYVEKRLKFDFLTSARENGASEENPVKLLENLTAIKARHAALCAEVVEIEAEQKKSMDSIREHLSTSLMLVEELQRRADVEIPPLTEKEQEAKEVLCSSVASLTVEAPPVSESQVQQQSQSTKEWVEVSEATFEAVPRSVRVNVKLIDLNTLYKQLYDYFSSEKRGPIGQQKMKKLNMKVSDAGLKTLRHLSLIELDKKGNVCLTQQS